MDLEEIKQKAESFFDWPSDERKLVTYTSAMLFAWHCCKDLDEETAKIHSINLLAMMENAAARCAEIAESRASEAEKNMNIYPDGDFKIEVYEMAMIECEYVAKDIRKEFNLSD